ncbi:MAG: hypothetical protein HY928_02205 [Elusimicrobia bacterium]|nr:hypothetical protein [Elusimicrobiota bacterium]
MRRSCAALLLLLSVPAAAADRLEKLAERAAAELAAKVPEPGAAVAVMPFEDASGRPIELGRVVAEALSRELLKTGKVSIQDRAYLSRMLSEIKLGLAGLTDPKAALQVGRFSGAKYLVVGRIETPEGKEAAVEARLVATESATLYAASRQTLKLDDALRRLYGLPAATDAAAAAFFEEEKLDDDAVFLERPGVSGCRWVRARGDVPAGKDQDSGHAAALALARRKAVARLLGHDAVKTPDFAESAFQGRLEEVLRATRSSLVEAESVSDEVRKGGRHRLVLETCLKPARGGDLKAELMLNQDRFNEGQEAHAIVTVAKSARIYLFSADFDGRAQLIWPAEGTPAPLAGPSKPLVFPDEAQQASGIRMRAALPAGRSNSIEMLRVLAVDGDADALLRGRPEWNAVIKALDESGLPWAEDARVYTVYKR